MPIVGGCLCGQLRFEIAAEKPIAARVCWCRVCQYLGAGTGTGNALFEKRALKTTGELAVYTSVADSGATMHRSFCPKCGTPVFSEAEPRPDFIIVRAGTLDDIEIGKPIGTIWTRSAPSWACIDEDLPKGEQGTLPAA
ncbi:MAG TPA: GFA family protein [Roseiarcus sp.]|nr:GFA family protein [Roseiarcus sp.]